MLRRLAEGGMGMVFLAFDPHLKRTVVVKVPHPSFMDEEAFRDRFRREVDDLLRVEHQSVVRVLDAGVHRGVPFLILPHLQGGDLRQLIHGAPGGRLSPDDIGEWLEEVASALDHLHLDKGLVHRDVKPSNILFDDRGGVYLSDFGLLKSLAAVERDLTDSGILPGSPAYMAPEQAWRARLTGAADQYALAATLYEALTGRLPFGSDNPIEIMLAKRTSRATSIRKPLPELPRAAADAVMRALSRSPEDRYETCRQFVHAYREGVDGAADPDDGFALPVAPGVRFGEDVGEYAEEEEFTGERRSKFSLGVFAVTSAICLALGIYLGLGRGDDPPPEPNDAPVAGSVAEQTAPDPSDPSEPPPPPRPEPARSAPPEIRLKAPAEGQVVHPGRVRVRGRVSGATAAGAVLVAGRLVPLDHGRFDEEIGLADAKDGVAALSVSYVPSAGEPPTAVRVRSVVVDSAPARIVLFPPVEAAPGHSRVAFTGRVTEENLASFTANGDEVSLQKDGTFRRILPDSDATVASYLFLAEDRAGNSVLVWRSIPRGAPWSDLRLDVGMKRTRDPTERPAIHVSGTELVLSGGFISEDLTAVLRIELFSAAAEPEAPKFVRLEGGEEPFRRVFPLAAEGRRRLHFAVASRDGTPGGTLDLDLVVDRTAPELRDLDVDVTEAGDLVVTGRAVDENLADVEVDGDPAWPDLRGAFRMPVMASRGSAVITARDRAGNVAREVITLPPDGGESRDE